MTHLTKLSCATTIAAALALPAVAGDIITDWASA